MPETSERRRKSILDSKQDLNRKIGSVAKMTRHREVMLRLLKGQKVKNIAADMGYQPASVSILIRTEGFQNELGKLQDILFEHVKDELSKVQQLVPLARGFYKNVLEDEAGNYTSSMKFQVSKDVMDRSGVKVAEKHIHEHQIGDVASLVTRAYEDSKIIDVESREMVEGDRGLLPGGDGKGMTGEELTKELKELMSGESIDVDLKAGDDKTGLLESEKGPVKTKEEEDEILQKVVRTRGSSGHARSGESNGDG